MKFRYGAMYEIGLDQEIGIGDSNGRYQALDDRLLPRLLKVDLYAGSKP